MLSSMSEIHLINKKISREELKKIAEERFGDLAKAVVDIEENIMAIGGELHADEEAFLFDRGSLQENLWGINLYPDKFPNNWIEFDSMINIRPSQNNRSRQVEDSAIRERVVKIVQSLIQ